MVTFVILHYKTIDETIECLECLKKTFSKNEYSAIVVDNNSLDKSDENKIRKYTEDLILLDENVGFAKANNKGCEYAIKKYNPDFIVVINNDVFITQKNFLKVVYKDYEKYEFDILGPWIDSRTGESCNPFPVVYGIDNVDAKIKYTKKLVKIYSSVFLTFLLNVYLAIKHFIKKPIVPTNHEVVEKNVALHGCALIFSKKYIKKFKDVFYEETFLFHEEEFLYDRIIKNNLVSIYDPELRVYHKEGASVNNKKSKRDSKLFKENEKLKSLELLKRIM